MYGVRVWPDKLLLGLLQTLAAPIVSEERGQHVS